MYVDRERKLSVANSSPLRVCLQDPAHLVDLPIHSAVHVQAAWSNRDYTWLAISHLSRSGWPH